MLVLWVYSEAPRSLSVLPGGALCPRLGLGPAQSRVGRLGSTHSERLSQRVLRKGRIFLGLDFLCELLVCWFTLRDLLRFLPFGAHCSLYNHVALSSAFFPSDPSLRSGLPSIDYLYPSDTGSSCNWSPLLASVVGQVPSLKFLAPS